MKRCDFWKTQSLRHEASFHCHNLRFNLQEHAAYFQIFCFHCAAKSSSFNVTPLTGQKNHGCCFTNWHRNLCCWEKSLLWNSYFLPFFLGGFYCLLMVFHQKQKLCCFFAAVWTKQVSYITLLFEYCTCLYCNLDFWFSSDKDEGFTKNFNSWFKSKMSQRHFYLFWLWKCSLFHCLANFNRV